MNGRRGGGGLGKRGLEGGEGIKRQLKKKKKKKRRRGGKKRKKKFKEKLGGGGGGGGTWETEA